MPALRIYMGGPTSLPSAGYAAAELASMGLSALAPQPRLLAGAGLGLLTGGASGATFSTGTSSDFYDHVAYTDVVWPTGTGWTSGAESTIIANIQALVNSSGSGSGPLGNGFTHYMRHRPAPGAVYPISTGIDLTGRNYLIFDGGGTDVDTGLYVSNGTVTRWRVTDTGHTGGATIRTSGSPGASHRSSVFYTKNPAGTKSATDLRFHGLTVEGSGVPGSTVASTTAGDGGETQHGWCLMGVDGAWVDHCISDKCKGDGVFATDAADGVASVLSRNVRITSSKLQRNGRMLVAMVGCEGLTITRCLLSDAAYAHVDSEPDQTHQTNRDLLIQECTFLDWGWDPDFYGSPLMLTASRTGITFAGYIRFIDNVLVGSSRTTGRPSEWNSEVTMSPYTAYTKTAALSVIGNIRISNFHAGPAVYLALNTGGTTITGNRFGITSGSIYGGTPGGSVAASDNT